MEYEIRASRNGEYYWNLLDNGEIIATSGDTHPTIQECRDEIARVKQSTDAPIRVTR